MKNFTQLHQPTDRFISLEQEEYLFLGGTAYLGLLNNPDYIELYKKGIDIYGLNNGTSRSNNVQLGIYNDAEVILAERYNFESAALFSSGYLAAQAAVHTFSVGKEVYYAPDAHPALWLADNKVSGNFEEWLTAVVDEINASTSVEFVIISNTLDNLKPVYYDFSLLYKVDENKIVHLILDDSHGIGVVRKNSISIDLSALRQLPNIQVTVLASLAKGMGTDAGIVLSSSANVTQLKRNPIFIGASPSSPAALYTLVHSEKIYNEEFDKLQRNIVFFKNQIAGLSFIKSIPEFAVFSSQHSNLFDYLLLNKVLISSFPYPLPTSSLLNRLVISSLHQEDDLVVVSNLLHGYEV